MIVCKHDTVNQPNKATCPYTNEQTWQL